MVLVRKREQWFQSVGEISVDWWDIPKRESIFCDEPQEGHLQYRAVLFGAVGIEQEGDADLKEVLHQGAWRL